MIIEELFSGCLDIVGDVHGEIRSLKSLLKRLGYDDKGCHVEERRLVFVGDLTDRGEDSPAVVELVASLVASGKAQCVLGNHELNILREDNKDGNSWYFGRQEHYSDGAVTNEKIASQEVADKVRQFFSSLPLALERSDLRVVHACWHSEHIQTLRSQSGDIVSLGRRLAEQLDERFSSEGLIAKAHNDAKVPLHDHLHKPPMLAALAELSVRRQNEHSIKVLSSGLEELAPEPFWAGGKWRFERRVPWWREYQGPMTVVGHYWRSQHPSVHLGKGTDLFADSEVTAPLGAHSKVMVVDYSIGKRAIERHTGTQQVSALAAFRWPEAELVFAPPSN